jgi:hypothetical protein
MDVLDACRWAGEIVTRAGFALRHASLKSEARYYTFRGRAGLLRIAAHAGKAQVIEGEPIVARLTFAYASPREESRKSLSLTMDMLEAQTAAAIGRFMIASGSSISGLD